jgi:hypothetical protein
MPTRPRVKFTLADSAKGAWGPVHAAICWLQGPMDVRLSHAPIADGYPGAVFSCATAGFTYSHSPDSGPQCSVGWTSTCKVFGDSSSLSAASRLYCYGSQDSEGRFRGATSVVQQIWSCPSL